ncbi:MAG TPA: hypothetical protein VK066_29735 [Chloroflexota bacterium]|nr:hypothetical protein [Chloroflexota bacterium]
MQAREVAQVVHHAARRPLVAGLAALALGTALLAPHSAFADQRDFSVVNHSGTVITQLYVSPSASNRWGVDQLGSAVIRPGNSFTLHFTEEQAGGTCLFDLRIVAADGTSTVDSGVNLCRTATVTFS